ncbi:hypothetical protein NX794_17615 [Streptomyces sp. LP11]|uniref:Secreted protein n=1 Tax=Streptomyces pyxinicus TaxID=2970331 RepID=A0ABT2B3J3_9ACTN|nr:hypothetical protein [Streptomyces sp. LP11]MCS0603017.1 hypothetical protein [Streptomyces sp. LP11]
MAWWVWLVAVIAVVGLVSAVTVGVQSKRRSGTVIAVRAGRPSGRGGGR